MKKLITLVMFLLLAFGYLACGGGYSPTGPMQPSNVTPTPGPPPTPY